MSTSRTLRHFSFLTEEEESHIFTQLPAAIESSTSRSNRAVGLGATLYSPGVRPLLEEDSMRAARIGVTSHVWCLEDSIPHSAVPHAEENVVAGLARLGALPAGTLLPMVFIRVRTSDQIDRLSHAAGSDLAHLTGFVVPKAHSANFSSFLEAAKAASLRSQKHLYLLPVLETPDLAWVETRREE